MMGRLWRDAKLNEIGAGTSEIRRMLIGRELWAASRSCSNAVSACWKKLRTGEFRNLWRPHPPADCGVERMRWRWESSSSSPEPLPRVEA